MRSSMLNVAGGIALVGGLLTYAWLRGSGAEEPAPLTPESAERIRKWTPTPRPEGLTPADTDEKIRALVAEYKESKDASLLLPLVELSERAWDFEGAAHWSHERMMQHACQGKLRKAVSARTKKNQERATCEDSSYARLATGELVEKADKALDKGEYQAAIPLLEKAIGQCPTAEMFMNVGLAHDEVGHKDIAQSWYARGRAQNGCSVELSQAGLTGITNFAVHDDPPRFALVTKLALAFAYDGATGKKLFEFDAPKHQAIAYGHSGETLLVDDGTGNITVRDATSGEQLAKFHEPAPFVVMGMSPDDKVLVIGTTAGLLHAYDFGTQKLLFSRKLSDRWITGVSWDESGSTLAAATKGDEVHILDAKTGEGGKTVNGSLFVELSPDGTHLATCNKHPDCKSDKCHCFAQTLVEVATGKVKDKAKATHVHGFLWIKDSTKLVNRRLLAVETTGEGSFSFRREVEFAGLGGPRINQTPVSLQSKDGHLRTLVVSNEGRLIALLGSYGYTYTSANRYASHGDWRPMSRIGSVPNKKDAPASPGCAVKDGLKRLLAGEHILVD